MRLVTERMRAIKPVLAACALTLLAACGGGARSAPSASSGPATHSGTSAPGVNTAAPSSASESAPAEASAWHPQALSGSAMPNPNLPPKSYGSPQALAAAFGCEDPSTPQSVGVGTQQMMCLLTGSQVPSQLRQQDDQEPIMWFASPAAEQQFASQTAQDTSDGSSDYVLFGNDWAVGAMLLPQYVEDLEYAQSVVGGSLVTYNGGTVEPYGSTP
jgi:hypothetical protein